jgi:hypothetical protein
MLYPAQWRVPPGGIETLPDAAKSGCYSFINPDSAVSLMTDVSAPPLAGLFRAGRVHGNPQEFFEKRNFALLVVSYKSLFGIVRESFSPSPGRLPLSPAPLAGFF